MPIFLIITIGLVIVLGGILGVVLFRLLNRELRNTLEKIADSINGRVESSLLGTPSIKGEAAQLPYTIKFYRGSQYSPPSLTISFVKKSAYKLSLRRENLDTKLSKKIGLAREITIGEAEFDEQFFISTSDEVRCRGFLDKAQVRDELIAMANMGWEMNITRAKIEINKTLRPPKGQAMAMAWDLIDGEELVAVVQGAAMILPEL